MEKTFQLQSIQFEKLHKKFISKPYDGGRNKNDVF